MTVDVDPTPLSPEQLKAQKSLKYGCLVMMALPVVMSLIMCSGVIRSSKSKEKTVSQPVTPDMAILTMPSGNDIPFTFSQAAYDRLKQLAEDKDAAGFAQLLLSGVAGKTPSGTICHIVASGPSSYEVLILEGPHIGKSAFVSPLYVKREKF